MESTVTVYEVWDFDWMASNTGELVLVETHATADGAQAVADSRNREHRQHFEQTASNGVERAEKESYIWRRAYVSPREVKP